MSDTDADTAEDTIARLADGLARNDRERFRREAEATLALSPHTLGPGSIYRTLVPVWRKFFHPPTAEHAATCGHLERRD